MNGDRDTHDAETGWLVLSYRMPSEPSRLRATVWRRLKGIGAIYLQNSVAGMPDHPAFERALRGLRAEILDLGGTAQLLRSQALAGARDLTAVYNTAREEEYVELLGRCADFLAEIETETSQQHFTYSELEENAEELDKLTAWYAKVRERDVLAAPRRDEVAVEIERCTTALRAFEQAVFDADSSNA